MKLLHDFPAWSYPDFFSWKQIGVEFFANSANA